MHVSGPKKSQKDPVSLEELRNVTPSAAAQMLVGLKELKPDESADLHYYPLGRSVRITS